MITKIPLRGGEEGIFEEIIEEVVSSFFLGGVYTDSMNTRSPSTSKKYNFITISDKSRQLSYLLRTVESISIRNGKSRKYVES